MLIFRCYLLLLSFFLWILLVWMCSDCPGPQAEEAGKADSCAGCPNQQICATAPKGPDPGIFLLIFLVTLKPLFSLSERRNIYCRLCNTWYGLAVEFYFFLKFFKLIPSCCFCVIPNCYLLCYCWMNPCNSRWIIISEDNHVSSLYLSSLIKCATSLENINKHFQTI